MKDNGLPCLDLLDATPGILRGLMMELTEADARWKPAPERFSVAETLGQYPRFKHSPQSPNGDPWRRGRVHCCRRAGIGIGTFNAVAPAPTPFSHVLGGTVPIPRVEGRSAAQNM